MPFLALVHLRDLLCDRCGALLATAGARSFIVDRKANPVNFSQAETLQEMTVELMCANGHTTHLNVPRDIAAEETLATPDDAPIGCDATIVA
jgi:hypothetical protein